MDPSTSFKSKVHSTFKEFTKMKHKNIDRLDIKMKRKIKDARLIVRNLSFKCSDKDILDYFSKYGSVNEVSLLRRNNKLVGCCFVQFDSKINAAKAIANLSGKEFMGRIIVVDWAISKDKYLKSVDDKSAIKNEAIENSGNKSDPNSNKQVTTLKTEEGIKEEFENPEEELLDIDYDQVSTCSSTKVTPVHRKDLTHAKIDRSSEADEDSWKNIRGPNKKDDPCDGRTLFIKNVPFLISNDDLKKALEKFGPVIYAVICIDPLTEHSKGTAFVKFNKKESADSCLNTGNDLTINGTVLYPHLALAKDEMINFNNKMKHSKDNRNLFLVKEGVVLPGTAAANGVSNTDMTKRLQLEQWKTQQLGNLSMFISRTRLIIHNLPPDMNDGKLFKLFKKHSPSNAEICEAKIMRHLRDVDEKGIGKSKGYGFVGFKVHEDALAALRAINNNPNIFSSFHRPIVSFSIENRNALRIKERRQLKIYPKNMSLNKDNKLVNYSEDNSNVGTFSGMTSQVGLKKLFTKKNFKKQEMSHLREVKKKGSTKKKNSNKNNQKKMREPKVINNKKLKSENDDFTKLVDKYKSKLMQKTNKKKWYD